MSCAADPFGAIMKTLRIVLLTVLLALAPSSAPAQVSEAAKKDLDLLQGEWSMVSGNADGFSIPDAMLKNSKRICQGNELTAIVGGQLIMKSKITLDPAKNPKTIDYAVIEGPTKGNKHLGIYEVNGDILKSCFGAPGEERPTDFTSKEGEHRTSTVWKRLPTVKPADSDNASRAEMGKFQGTWVAVSLINNGKTLLDDKTSRKDDPTTKLAYEGNHWLVKSGDKTFATGVFKVDATKTPKEIDILDESGVMNDKAKLGIYELEGDHYKYCLAPAGKPRPMEFSSKEGSGVSLGVSKREKP
jgi:uncharacterized protein (TIGR03067 family)